MCLELFTPRMQNRFSVTTRLLTGCEDQFARRLESLTNLPAYGQTTGQTGDAKLQGMVFYRKKQRFQQRPV